MSKIAITVDSSCDMPKGFKEEHDIKVFPFALLVGDETFIDGVDITPVQLLEKTREVGKLPKTSATPISVYEENFEQLLNDYDEIIHFSISSKASSSFQNSEIAAKKFNGRVTSIDTKSLSGGMGLIVNKAVILKEMGKSAKEICDEIYSILDKVQLSFVVDVMDFLYKGGRCSAMQYYGTKILKIHPEIAMIDGQLKSRNKYMGSIAKCYKKYADDLIKNYPDYDDSVCYITHSPSTPELVQPVIEYVKENFHFKKIYELDASATITCHCGQNTLGILFIAK